MPVQTVTCPKCGHEFEITEALAQPFVEAARVDVQAELTEARRAGEGRQGKADRLCEYMTGPSFACSLRGIADPFIKMQDDLVREKAYMMTAWNRRQKYIDRVLEAAFGMKGDIEGLAGADLKELGDIKLSALTARSEEE
jgi:hypothetical protein